MGTTSKSYYDFLSVSMAKAKGEQFDKAVSQPIAEENMEPTSIKPGLTFTQPHLNPLNPFDMKWENFEEKQEEQADAGIYDKIVKDAKQRANATLKNPIGRKSAESLPSIESKPLSDFVGIGGMKRGCIFYLTGDMANLAKYMHPTLSLTMLSEKWERMYLKCIDYEAHPKGILLASDLKVGYKAELPNQLLADYKVVITTQQEMINYLRLAQAAKMKELEKCMIENKQSFSEKDYSEPFTSIDMSYILLEQGITSGDTFLRYNQTIGNDAQNINFLVNANEDIKLFIPVNWLYACKYSKKDATRYLEMISSLELCDPLQFDFKPNKEGFNWINNNMHNGIKDDEFLTVQVSGENEFQKYLAVILISALTYKYSNNIPGLVLQINSALPNLSVWECIMYASIFNSDGRLFVSKDVEINKKVKQRTFVNMFSSVNRLESLPNDRIIYPSGDVAHCYCPSDIFKKYLSKFDLRNAEKQFNEYKNLIYGK